MSSYTKYDGRVKVKVIVIGGGAAGMLSAIVSAKCGNEVTN